MKQFARSLRHKIIILSKRGDDSWEEKYHCFASIENFAENNFSLHENIDFGILISKNYKILRTRCLENIAKNMRVKFKDNLYEIVKIIDEKEEGRVTQLIISQI